jgi:26S proteasome regulatory subunit N10
MKKNNISIDVIAFGDLSDDNLKKLQGFNENIKGGDGSHLEVIQPGPNLLSDSILATPILAGDGVGGAGAGGTGGDAGASGSNDFEFGVNPELDPELALALRMSYEEEKARVEKEKKAKEESEKEKLEGIPEADEKQPLLDRSGEPSEGGASGSGTKPNEDKKDKPDDADKMDTA